MTCCNHLTSLLGFAICMIALIMIGVFLIWHFESRLRLERQRLENMQRGVEHENLEEQ